ncbi:MAG: hypothetical protein WAQ98_23385 [Blastocatellia bacterium]
MSTTYPISNKHYNSNFSNFINSEIVKSLLKLLLRLDLIAQIAFGILLYRHCSYCPSNKPFNYQDHVVSRVIRNKGKEERFESVFYKSCFPKLFLSPSEFLIEEYYKLGCLEDDLELYREKLSNKYSEVNEDLLDKMLAGDFNEKEKEKYDKFLAEIKPLEVKINDLKQELAEGKRQLAKLNYYDFDYWHSACYYRDTEIGRWINSGGLLNVNQPTLKHLPKLVGFDLPVLIESEVLTGEYTCESMEPKSLINNVLLLLLILRRTINATDERHSTTLVNGQQIKRYFFNFPLNENCRYRWVVAFYYRDFRGKNFLIITPSESRLASNLLGTDLY